MLSLTAEQLVSKIPQPVFEIFQKFTEKNYQIYLVGGAVRDLLLGREIHDVDFATNAHPEEIQKLLPESFYDNVFGTVGLMVGQEKYEITTYRREHGYTDRRRPDQISWGQSLKEDVIRRDFTINALAMGPKLEIIDLVNGQEDLEKKIIRAVGAPEERFAEDALRMMRAIRFATQLGFTIEPETFAAIQKNNELIKFVSWERIRDELFKILTSPYPVEGITLLYTSGLLGHILPELVRCYGVTQAKHHKLDVWTHSLESLRHVPSQDPIVRLATLLHDIGKPITAKGEGQARTFYNHEVVGGHLAAQIAQRLRLSKKDSERLFRLVRWHLFTVDERQTDAAIRRFIRHVGQENLEDILALRVGDRLGGGAKETSWRLEKFKERLVEVQKQPFTVTDLKVNGFDIMKIFGIPPGPKVGGILNQIFQEVVEQKTPNERETLLKRLEEIKKQGNSTRTLEH